MRLSIHHKITLILTALIAVILSGIYVYLNANLREYTYQRIRTHLSKEVSFSRTYLDQVFSKSQAKAIADQMGRDLRLRVTLVDFSGRVLGDSQLDQESLMTIENHLSRPEIQMALQRPLGESRRFSTTVRKDMLYMAMRFNQGFVRLSIPLSEIEMISHNLRRMLLISLGFAFLVAIIFGSMAFKFISKPIREISSLAKEIAHGNYTKRVTLCSRDEIGELAQSINYMSEQISARIEEATAHKAQFESVISELRCLENVRRDFVANVSHEIRTPLTSIKGYAETLSEGAIHDKANAKNFLDIITKETDRLVQLVDDLLDLSKIESGKLDLRMRPCDLYELTAHVMAGLRKQARDKNIRLVNHIARDMTKVLADEPGIAQVLLNLISNGIKYNQPNGSVTVKAQETRDGVRVDVADTGIGIPSQDIPRIFERFYRVDKARSRELGGTGLGLSIVKHIIQSHGGEVFVQSVLGKGSVFSFTLSRAATGE